MNPSTLKIRNLRTWRELDLELWRGVTVIAGDNGAGKSTLANAIDWTLFGPDARSWGPYLTQGVESTELELELHFEHGGRLFKVRRGYSARGAGKATLDFETLDELTLSSVALTRETAKATQELIEQTIGLTRETFRASSMLVQGDGAAFTEAQPRDRKQILAGVLGLEIWDRLLDAVRADLSDGREESAARAVRIDGILLELEEKESLERAIKVESDILADSGKITAKAEKRRAELDEKIRLVAQQAAAQAATVARAAQLTAELVAMDQRLARSRDARQALHAAEQELAKPAPIVTRAEATLEALMAERENFARLDADHRQAKQNAETLTARRDAHLVAATTLAAEAKAVVEQADSLNTASATCPTCGQLLGSHAETAVGELTARAGQINAKGREQSELAEAIVVPSVPTLVQARAGLDEEIDRAKTELTTARAIATERAGLEERRRMLADEVVTAPTDEEVEKLRRDWTEADEAQKALPPIPDELAQAADRHELAKLHATLEEERIRWTVATTGRAKAEGALERLQKLEEELETLRPAHDAAQARLDRLAVLERAYGRDGIPALIVQNVALPSIERDANRILADLGAGYHVELRSERALQGGGVTDALDVVVKTDAGERPYETFSGGERTRLNLALRIGLARLLANRRGSESRLLVIDEPEYLDDAGTAGLLEVLGGLGSDFDRIWLISHVAELRTAAADQTVTIVNSDGRSTFAG